MVIKLNILVCLWDIIRWRKERKREERKRERQYVVITFIKILLKA